MQIEGVEFTLNLSLFLTKVENYQAQAQRKRKRREGKPINEKGKYYLYFYGANIIM